LSGSAKTGREVENEQIAIGFAGQRDIDEVADPGRRTTGADDHW
jgi:hypothetical protein